MRCAESVKMADEEYESVVCVKNEVQIYRIPPRTSNRGYRAADWKLEEPDWNGRLRICVKGQKCYIKLEDKSTGELFAKCPVDSYPGIAVEGVLDSSRYFVLRIENEDGRHAFIGMGFQDRGDSFDFNVALQDHFKWVKQSERLAAEAAQPDNTPKLDLGFKEGQTIHINISKKSGSAANQRPKAQGNIGFISASGSGGTPRLAPPPGSSGLSPLAGRRVITSQQPTQPQASADLFGDMSAFAPSSQSSQVMQAAPSTAPDQWGDFTSATGNSDSGDSWVQF